MVAARPPASIHDENQKPTVLIGGDTQFIGHYLRELLIQQNCHVIFSDDLTDQKIESLDYVFYLGPEEEEKIKELLEITKKFDARFLLGLAGGLDAGRGIESFLSKEKVDWRLVYLGYVYGPRMTVEQYQEILQLIEVIKIKPIFIADAVYILIKAMFASGTSGKKFDLGDQAVLGWQPKTSLKEGLKQTEEFFSKTRKGETKTEPTVVEEKEKKRKKTDFFKTAISSKKILVVATAFLFVSFLSYPFLSLALDVFLGARSLQKAQEAALEANFSGAIVRARRAQASFSRLKGRTTQLAFLFTFLGQSRAVDRAEKIFSLGEKVALGIVYATQGAERASELGMIIFKGEEGAIESLITEIRQNLSSAYQQLSFVEGMIRAEPALLATGSSLGLNYSDEILVEKIPEIKELMTKVDRGLPLLPDLVGLGRKQTYLVLLQNNMELRPTGGFIGSFALLTFDKGELLDFEVRDVYSADGQLKGHVEPPPELKEHLGEAGWYLRDSNWDPDFPTSAARAAWFLEKETGRTVDGVLGINLFFAQKLLRALGEVDLPDYQEKISADNLFERAEYHSEVNFFPGSTQKQDFLGSLARALFVKVKNSDTKGWLNLSQGIYQGLREKDVLIYLNNREAMAAVADLGWEGGVRDINCSFEGGTCLVDYLMVVDANLGVNKANYFVKRSFSRRLQGLADGVIEGQLMIDYKNESQSEVFPAGRYKNYLRILTPLATELQSVKINGKELAEEEISQTILHGKQIFGFLVEVPIQEERRVEVAYRLAEKMPEAERVQYLFLLQKQSGIKDEKFDFWFTASEGTTVVETKPKASFTKQTVIFTPEFDQDLIFEIKMIK